MTLAGVIGLSKPRDARFGLPVLDFDFTKGTLSCFQTGLVPTFTRSGSVATRVKPSGVIETLGTDVPRFDHNLATLAAKGLLIEEQRTNLLLYSRDLSNAAWTKSSMTATLTATGADGVANSASTITASGANGTVLQAVVSASAARATKAMVKRRTGSGTVQMTQNGGTLWTTIAVTANWTEVTIPSATVTNPSVGFKLVTSGDAIDVDFCMLESASYSASAIPTTSAQVTRTNEELTLSGAAFTSWFNAAAGTFVVEADAADTAGNHFAICVSDGTANNEIGILTSSVVSNLINTGGVLQANLFGGTVTANTTFKAALAYASNDVAAAFNGALLTPDTSVTLPVVNQLTIGRRGNNSFWQNGHIRRLRYFPTRLTDAQLQAIST